ncbi:MAG: glucose-6-phosphate dehydrogenase [bacterium]|nr:glucose-6-phosphate dehydrogenase [bacterium]
MPTVFVILGATGDLMRRKLIPALFHHYQEGLLPKMFQIVGFSRDVLTKESFQAMVQEMTKAKVAAPKEKIDEFSRFFVYQQGVFEEKEGYKSLAQFLGMRDRDWKTCSNKLFYIAAHPQHYKTILQNLKSSGLTKPCSPEEGWTRIIVEKPFGKDLKTAQELDRLLGKLFREEQIYRMDHYLGKETVQNILAFRFSNSFLEPAWNKDWIESVCIRLLEADGIGDRGIFYDGIGAFRDVGQNHMLQLLALFLMETPSSFDGDAVRQARAEVLKALKAPKGSAVLEKTARGQYEGYQGEQNVAADSKTETYFRIITSLNNARWKGVPITLESGKAMEKDLVEAQITFRHPTPCLCPDKNRHQKNVLRYTIEPDEGVKMSFWVKKPGSKMQIEERSFSFNYREAFKGDEFQEAYERLLLNIIQGDQTLFVSTEEIMASWKFVDSIVRGWDKAKVPLVSYLKGAPVIET